MNTTLVEKKNKAALLDKSWEYLHDHFHKFSEGNKIRIALELCKKDMPNKLEGEVNANVTMMPLVKIDGKDQEVKIGT